MYNVNWLLLLAQNTFIGWIKPLRLIWANVFIAPVRVLYNTFLQYRLDALYKLNFNGQIIYLEHVLNDRFDNIGRGIYIDNVADQHRMYWYNAGEGRDAVYVYNNYDAANPYVVGEYSVYDNKVWVCTNATTGDVPFVGSGFWDYFKDVDFYKNLIEYQSAFDFIVMVPVAVTFDTNEMKALVNYYKCAGKRYTIETF